jgi:hypothetical protein
MCTLVLMEGRPGTTISSVLRVSVDAVLDQLMGSPRYSMIVVATSCLIHRENPTSSRQLLPTRGLGRSRPSAHALCLPPVGDALNRICRPRWTLRAIGHLLPGGLS